MGHRYFNLDIKNKDDVTLDHNNWQEIIDDLRNNNENAEFAFNDEGISENEINWWECDDEIKEFSKKYPDAVFKLTGYGIDNEDWISYYLNGKMQECFAEVIYEEYDEAKLK